MRSRTNLGRAALAALAIAGGLATRAAAFDVTAGTIVGEDSVAPGGSTCQLVEYLPNGTINETLNVTGTAPLGVVDGLAIIGSDLFLCGTNSAIGKVNLTTGAIATTFAVAGSGVEALGNIGNDLLVNTSTTSVARYTTAGVLVNTINLTGGGITITGIDSDGTRIFAGDHTSGNIRVYNLSGTLLNTINTGIGASSMSGLGYDPATDRLVISTGFNQDDIRFFNATTGAALPGTFPAQRTFIDGLDVVPLPEPSGIVFFSTAGVIASTLRRRRAAH